jgi:hypothetical protein
MEWLALNLRNDYLHGSESGVKLAETVLAARTTLKSLNAAKEVSAYTRDLARSTKNLAVGTWAIAIITLVTQLTILALTFKR